MLSTITKGISQLARAFGTVGLTESAATKLKEVLSDNEFLRLGIETGGCAGFNYSFLIDDTPLPDDDVTELEGACLHVDAISLPYLSGASVDFIREPFREFFAVTNPNAASACHCGDSFEISSVLGLEAGTPSPCT